MHSGVVSRAPRSGKPRRGDALRSSRLLEAGAGLLAAWLLLGACTAHPSAMGDGPGDEDMPHPAHWSYMGIEGPDHWAMLSQAYRTCEAGHRQSPVNIERTHPVQQGAPITFRYNTSRLFEVNNGHTIQVSHETGCSVELGTRTYKLRQFHFHAPSEHHVHDRAYPMEMHLVHQNAAGEILVIAVLMETGAPDPVLAPLWRWLPAQMGREVSLPLELDITSLLPLQPHYFAYSGSLTTPPCTEGVRWAVLKDPVRISEEDVRRFVDLVGYNARPVQPLGDREISDY